MTALVLQNRCGGDGAAEFGELVEKDA